MSPTSCSEVAERSPISRWPIADQSPTSFSDSQAPIQTKQNRESTKGYSRWKVGDRSATSRRLIGDCSATLPGPVCNQIRRSQSFEHVQKSPTSRRLLCNLAGTDRGPCCDLCDWWKLSVAERSQRGCNECLTGALLDNDTQLFIFVSILIMTQLHPRDPENIQQNRFSERRFSKKKSFNRLNGKTWRGLLQLGLIGK